MNRFRIKLSDPAVFFKKLLLLCLATLALVPLIYYKLSIPAFLYLAFLLVIHIAFLVLYLAKVDWRSLVSNKTSLILRLVGVLFFAFLLMVLKYVGDPIWVLFNIALAFTIHIFILLLLMVTVHRTKID